MPDRDDNDRPKPSWREIDKRRDQSLHTSKDQLRRESVRAKRASSGYRQSLDTFFDGGKAPVHVRKQLEQIESPGKSDRMNLIQGIKSAMTSDAIQSAINEYLLQFKELPNDFDVLVQALLHPDEDIARQAIGLLTDLLGKVIIKKKGLLLERLRRLENLADEQSTKDSASGLRRLLK